MDSHPVTRQPDFFPPAPPGYLAVLQDALRAASIRWQLPPDIVGHVVPGAPFNVWTIDDVRPDHIAGPN